MSFASEMKAMASGRGLCSGSWRSTSHSSSLKGLSAMGTAAANTRLSSQEKARSLSRAIFVRRRWLPKDTCTVHVNPLRCCRRLGIYWILQGKLTSLHPTGMSKHWSGYAMPL